MNQENDALLEKLARLEHERWSRWMQYLFSRCVEIEDHVYVIPASPARRWQEQMHAPYEILSEAEKESDRKEARRTLAALPFKNMKAVSIAIELLREHDKDPNTVCYVCRHALAELDREQRG